ncbi:hypothetical protein AcW1_001345 [Taiwanofungus camphoratus]|nr:hypothetical protein AcW1_001345 [Antrodia cinnamomea]
MSARTHRKPLEHNGTILPMTSERHCNGTRPWWSRWYTRRHSRIALLAVLALAFIALFRSLDGLALLEEVAPIIEDLAENHIFPPLYGQYHEQEMLLPQHNPDLPYPEGREGKYIWFPNHVHASGWGNAMQELLLNSYLAYGSGRAFVFDNYTWNRDGSDYTDYNGKLIPSRIPYTVQMRGPSVGDPFPPGDPAPRSVIKEYWDQVCPSPTIISSDEVTYSIDKDASALTLFNNWVEKLNSVDDRCIEIDKNSGQIFSIWVFGTNRILDIWPTFSKSPILNEFRWSPLIENAFNTNRPIFSPASRLDSYIPSFPFFSNDDPYAPLPGLLVLHIRRGDFADHCMHLAKWSSGWNGFNSFPELPDKFEVPLGGGWGETTRENMELYMQHCFPSIEQIVAKTEAVRQTRAGRGLKNVYIMTNGAKSWVDDLKAALMSTGHWKKVTGSRDVKLNWEQKYVAQAVDMLIGQRAQVLIGNGFSSLTSNIVMLRMARNIPPDSNRFW